MGISTEIYKAMSRVQYCVFRYPATLQIAVGDHPTDPTEGHSEEPQWPSAETLGSYTAKKGGRY